MADIPISETVRVTISTTPKLASRAGFGTLLFVTTSAENAAATNPIPYDTEGVRYYTSLEAVGADWQTTTEVYAAATTWYGQSPRPTRFAVGARDLSDADVTATMVRLDQASKEWYFFAFEKNTRDVVDTDVQDLAAWAEAKTKEFFTCTNDADVFDPGVTTDIGYILNNLAYRRTLIAHGAVVDEYPEVAISAIAATTNFDAENSVKTLNLKQLAGITPAEITEGEMVNAFAKGVNVYVTQGGINVFKEGFMAAGIGVWQDVIHFVDWLQNAIEINVFNLLLLNDRIAYTDAGTAQIQQKIEDALSQGVRNGGIAPGETIAGEFLKTGYIVTVPPVSSVPTSQKQQRIAPTFEFVAIGSGAIHHVIIEGTYEG